MKILYFRGATVPSILKTPSVAIKIIRAPFDLASLSCSSSAVYMRNNIGLKYHRNKLNAFKCDFIAVQKKQKKTTKQIGQK